MARKAMNKNAMANKQGKKGVQVSGYTRKDGTKVSGYSRSNPTR